LDRSGPGIPPSVLWQLNCYAFLHQDLPTDVAKRKTKDPGFPGKSIAEHVRGHRFPLRCFTLEISRAEKSIAPWPIIFGS
jgi:hypothetical protein